MALYYGYKADKSQDTYQVDGKYIAGSSFVDDDVADILEVMDPIPFGTLKMVLANSLNEIDTSTPDGIEAFDGWAYPDGRLVSTVKFPFLKGVFPYATGYGESYVQLPDLRSFFKLGNTQSTAVSHVAGKNQLPAHTHNLNGNIVVSNTLFVWITGTDGHTELEGKYFDGTDIPRSLALHGAKPPADSSSYRKVGVGLTIDKSAAMPRLTIGETGTTETAMWPAYVNMPVMIYIGRPLRSNETWVTNTSSSRYPVESNRVYRQALAREGIENIKNWMINADGIVLDEATGKHIGVVTPEEKLTWWWGWDYPK